MRQGILRALAACLGALTAVGAGCDPAKPPPARAATAQRPLRAVDPPPAAQATPRPLPQVIPWIEVNNATPAEIDNAVAGLRVWQRATDTAIVTTTVGRARLYRELQARLPGMKIIPGVKTAGYCAPFDALEGWRTIAREVALQAEVTGQKRVVLENETALANESAGNLDSYWDARVELDFDRLRRGLELLPDDVEIWWAPSFVTGSNRAIRHAQSERLCRLVEDVCNVRFIDAELAMPPERNKTWAPELTSIRDRVATRPSVPIIYFYFKSYWPTERFDEALGLVKGDAAIIYPGATAWEEAARLFTPRILALQARRPSVDPPPPTASSPSTRGAEDHTP